MPADDGVWVTMMSASAQRDQSCCTRHRILVRALKLGSRPLPLEHSKLLAKGEYFEGCLGAAADEHSNHGQESEEE